MTTMFKTSHATPIRLFKESPARTATFLTVILVVLVMTYWCTQHPTRNENVFSVVSIPPTEHFGFDGTKTPTPLIFPNAFAAVWQAHPHLVAIGITLRSDEHCLRAHAFHSETWGSFPDVARRANSFQGLVLPLYLAAAVQNTVPYWDVGVQQRLNRDGNILIFRSMESKRSTGWGGDTGLTKDYGPSAQFPSVKKESLWFRYAYNHFRYTPFLAKADLDVYINIPAYLSVLQQLPRVSTSYGKSRPAHQMFCMGKTVFMHILSPLYTATRDVTREVFTEPALTRLVGNAYKASDDPDAARIGLYDDTVHSKALFRRYAFSGVQRAFPTEEFNDAQAGAFQLPPIAGMGKLYMEQIAKETPDMPLSGTVQGLFGYSYTYNLPGPLKRTHLIFVTDNCRYRDERYPKSDSYSILSHHTATKSAFKAQHRKYNIGTNTFAKMSHPTQLEVENHQFYYHVALSSIYCWFDGSLLDDPAWDFPPCWLSRPSWATEPPTA